MSILRPGGLELTRYALEKAGVKPGSELLDVGCGDGSAAAFARDKILPAMADLRADADALEMLVPKKDWPFPTYGDLLFSVQ